MGYDWKITAMKMLKVGGLGAVTGLLAWLASLHVDPYTTVYIVAGTMILTGIRNVLENT